MRIRSSAVLGVERTPPTEFQLWKVGANPTDYGVHVWNERSIASVLARYSERGNPILLDVEHNGALLEDGEPAQTAGYARLEVRAGAPWLVFEWSDYGREQIESGQRRFLSPEYDVDKNTGEILALYRVSLVADPGTHRARMLAAARNEEHMDLSVILAALRAALAAEDPAVAKESISNLLAELSKSAGSGGETPTETPAAAAPPDGAPEGAGVAAASPGDGDENKDQDDTKAGSKVASAPVVAPAVAAAAKVVAAAQGADVAGVAASAVKQIRDAQRDHLLATQGARLEPALRRWASAQPLEIVEGLFGALPAPTTNVQRAAATRGATQGTASTIENGLPLEEHEQLRKAMGIQKVSATQGPHVDGNRLILPTETPTQARARIAAAGKAGK